MINYSFRDWNHDELQYASIEKDSIQIDIYPPDNMEGKMFLYNFFFIDAKDDFEKYQFSIEYDNKDDSISLYVKDMNSGIEKKCDTMKPSEIKDLRYSFEFLIDDLKKEQEVKYGMTTDDMTTDDILYWMNRNEEGLYEVGYLLTKEQLLKETDFTEDDINLLNEYLKTDASSDNRELHDEVEGSYGANDTFTVHALYPSELKYIKDLLTWKNFNPYESVACSEHEKEYPDFVNEAYRLPVQMRSCTGETSFFLPKSCEMNKTVLNFKEKLDLKAGQCKYDYNALDYFKADLSTLMNSREFGIEDYNDLCNENGIQPNPDRFVVLINPSITKENIVDAEEKYMVFDKQRDVYLTVPKDKAEHSYSFIKNYVKENPLWLYEGDNEKGYKTPVWENEKEGQKMDFEGEEDFDEEEER